MSNKLIKCNSTFPTPILLFNLFLLFAQENNKPCGHDWATSNGNGRLNGDGPAFDLFNALDRLGLGSNDPEVADVLSYPPGFDVSSGLHNGGRSSELSRQDWSSTNGITNDLLESSILNGIFANGHGGTKSGSDFSDGSGSGKIIVKLQQISTCFIEMSLSSYPNDKLSGLSTFQIQINLTRLESSDQIFCVSYCEMLILLQHSTFLSEL